MQLEFSQAMARLGPFGDRPRMAVAVSGGADSTALALLMQGWVASQAGSLLALIVDHGLRAESGREAQATAARLAARGIAAEILKLEGLGAGSRLQESARAARYEALGRAARAAGCLFLATGHHAGDQSETVAMRAARGAHGLEGMAGWAARGDFVLLRPLLAVTPARLKAFLTAQGVGWVEDPSNRNPAFERVRMREAGAADMPADGHARRAAAAEAAAFIARHVTIRPEGFAVVAADAAPALALAALLRVVAGADYPPLRASTAALAAGLRAATLGGVRLAKTAKYGGGWLLAREPAACAKAVPAVAGVVWDGRFRLRRTVPGALLGGLGADAGMWRATGLPALVRQTLPCLRRNGEVDMAPPAGWFCPLYPAAGHWFVS